MSVVRFIRYRWVVTTLCGLTAAAAAPDRARASEFIWPCTGSVTSLWGDCRDGCSRFHAGVDIGAPTGREIYAACEGTIVYRGWYSGYGNTIDIQHDGNWVTRYAHQSAFAEGLNVGSLVSQGELIGFVGNTGNSSGPHLHFEIRQGITFGFENSFEVPASVGQGVTAGTAIPEDYAGASCGSPPSDPPPAPAASPGVLDLSSFMMASYGTQDIHSARFHIRDAGQTIHLWGNTWKRFLLPYMVTGNTVLEFDYWNDGGIQPEVGGLGLDTDDALSTEWAFNVYGSQSNYGHLDYNDYAPDNWSHYIIPVGDFFTGTFDRMVFINDKDSGVPANSAIANVLIVESTTTPVITQHPEPQYVRLAASAQFQVTVSGHALTYRWQKDQADIPGAASATFALTDVGGADEGGYRCVVSNNVGSVASGEAPLVLVAPGDFDFDGDVDQEDFGRFQRCLSGASVPQNGPACQAAKFDADSDVDQDDFGILQGCVSGANVPADPACGG